MSQYIQFCLILFGLSLFKAAVIIETNNESRNLYCEIFQNINFDGESLQIPESNKITNFTHITQSWGSSEHNGLEKFHSFKLPSLISPRIKCVINACSSENFQGNCTVFKLSRKRVHSHRLKSFECNCFNEQINTSIENDEKVEVSVNSDDDQSTVKSTCEDGNNTIFKNFTKHGKKIIGVGRNYM